jgi:superoxide dismutase
MPITLQSINEKMCEIKKAMDQNKAQLNMCIQQQKNLEDEIIGQLGMIRAHAFWVEVIQKENAEKLTTSELEKKLVEGGTSEKDAKAFTDKIDNVIPFHKKGV